MSTKKQQYLRLFLLLLFLAVLLAFVEWFGLRQHFSLEFMRQRIEENRTTGLLLFILLFVLGNLVHIPGWIFLAAAVLSLGQGMGGMVTYVAANISCSITFLLIRAIGGDALRNIEHPLALKIMKRLELHPVQSVVLLRTIFQTMPAINYALALSGIPFRKYVLGTLLGLPLPIALYCVFFEHLAKALHF
ncbi:MAG: VTT domain-containing protein [Methylophilaceae bacterium]